MRAVSKRLTSKPLNVSIRRCRHWRPHPAWTGAGYCSACKTVILVDKGSLIRKITHESIHAALHSLRVRDRYDWLPEHVHYLVETVNPQWKVNLYRIFCILREYGYA